MAESHNQKQESCCSCREHTDKANHPGTTGAGWNLRYIAALSVLAALWGVVYFHIQPAARWLSSAVFGLDPASRTGAALEFFIYDTIKILMLLIALIYAISWLRAALDAERVRDFLTGKKRGLGYMLGAVFGAVTPFCSCSSIPLFLGFTTAGIPIGITMSFLITSPLVNEIAVVLLWGMLGWKFTLLYAATGIAAGIIGGFFMDGVKAGRWLQPFVLEAINNTPAAGTVNGQRRKLTLRLRHDFALSETLSIFKRVWKWVVIGVAVGAGLHGFVPQNWFAENLGAGEWWTVPAAVFVAIPLYSNVTGIVPVMESLLAKGLPLGTTMAFCMSAVAASIPEVMMLRQIMTIKLQAAFIGYLWVILTLAGWLFNAVGSYIR